MIEYTIFTCAKKLTLVCRTEPNKKSNEGTRITTPRRSEETVQSVSTHAC